MPSRHRYATIKPGQFHCLIIQCARKGCDNWFLGTPASRFCPDCKPKQYAQVKLGWQRQHRNTGRAPHKPSRFSEEEIKEMRDMFLRMPVKEIAKHFGCHPSLIYKYQKRNPLRHRAV